MKLWKRSYLGMVILALALSAVLVVAFCKSGVFGYLYVLVAFWALAPPIWFICEYTYFFKKGLCGTLTFDEFKHGQHLAASVWLGVAALGLASLASLHS